MGKYIDIFCNMECIIVFHNISDKFQFVEQIKTAPEGAVFSYVTESLSCPLLAVLRYRPPGKGAAGDYFLRGW